ncbi:MAG: hypothetical protein OXG61_13255 [Chloroflexi bacterium]|nr:hypothetical protein [Chloroflexota bacterium]
MTAAETREWRIVAFLDDEDDPDALVDPVHSPELARELGFAGALVAGDNLWGWSVPAILETLGEDWLDHGWARFRFRQPVYPGDDLRITLTPADNGAFTLRMANPAGIDCVVGEVGPGANAALADFERPTRMDPALAPDPLPELRVDPALAGVDWTPLAVDASPEVLRAYMELSHRSADPLFAGDNPRLHPAWLVGRPEALMRHNFVIIGSIHTRTEIEFLAPAFAGGEVVTGGRCVAVYERKGRPFVEFDCLVRGPDGRDLARMRHTTIYDAMAGIP